MINKWFINSYISFCYGVALSMEVIIILVNYLITYENIVTDTNIGGYIVAGVLICFVSMQFSLVVYWMDWKSDKDEGTLTKKFRKYGIV